MNDEQPTRTRPPWWDWALATVGVSLFIAALIWGPWWIEERHLRDQNGELVSSAGIIITGLRTAFIAIVAGAIGGLGLWYTRQNHHLAQRQFEEGRRQFADQLRQSRDEFQLAQQQFEHTQRQFEYEQEKDRGTALETSHSRITESFITATKLLGSESVSERLGAIYTLERIARESRTDRDSIRRVLDSFRQQRSMEESSSPGRPGRGWNEIEDINAASRVSRELSENPG
ncbi:hypothetical protein ACWGH2_04055 [Streptomyces sp. NPDC054871]